jgi:hypothetical protein
MVRHSSALNSGAAISRSDALTISRSPIFANSLTPKAPPPVDASEFDGSVHEFVGPEANLQGYRGMGKVCGILAS